MMTNEWIDDGWKEWRKKTDCYVTQHNNYSKLHSTLHYIQYITLQYITVHYTTLQYITLHYITLQYKPRVGEMTHEWTSGYQKNTINYTTKRCVKNT